MNDKLKEYITGLSSPQLALPALKVALFVGTILFVINHATAVLSDSMTTQRWIAVALSYVVPYMVSIHGRVFSNRR